MSVRKGPGLEYWQTHLEAIAREGIGTKAYAQREGLAASSLYYWRRRLKARGVAAPTAVQSPPPSSPARLFVPVALGGTHDDAVHPVLTLASGLRLELSALPSPQWLAQLSQALARPGR